ncbi:hypothetical protein SETIT_1G131100v2 [Setaria italica]|uniref:Protein DETOXIFICATION n=1 Tax=Setaria italica TaxID=4555 RepID=A0A368PJT8_SETIT|nr:hypothetical protein SETIT_1G131100v2 [Setaria italica]
MEAPLLTVKDTEQRVEAHAEGSFWSEVKTQLYLAGPLVAGYLLMNITQMISIMFVGHLGKLELASVSIATSFAAVTGLCVLAGMATGLDTLCGQAFGAGQHHLLGVHKHIPVAVLWAYASKILSWCVQDPEIATAAGSYVRWLIPSLFVFPWGLGHPAVCWLLVNRLGLGSKGVALANAVSYLVNLSLMALYIRLSPSCKATWTGFSGEAFRGIPGFLKLAVPSAAMVCMEWWSFELLVLLAGLLPSPKLETAVLSICTRVSNEHGAGRPHVAHLATQVVMFLAFSVCVSEGILMVLARNLLGYAYSNDEDVAKYAARVMPVLAVCILFDGLQTVLSGVVRGCGRQKLGAVINLVAYYVAGIPAAFFFAFVCHLGGMVLRAKDGVFSSNLLVDTWQNMKCQ